MLTIGATLLAICIIVGGIVLSIIYWPRKIKVIAQKSIIIRKKIILEAPVGLGGGGGGGDGAGGALLVTGNSDLERALVQQKGFDDTTASAEWLAPLGKIHCKMGEVDIDAESLSRCGGTQYEFPQDEKWEVDREK